MRIAGWIPKATNTHSKYVTLSAFQLQQLSLKTGSINRHTRLSVSSPLHSVVQLSYYTEYTTGWPTLEFWLHYRWGDINTYTTESTLFIRLSMPSTQCRKGSLGVHSSKGTEQS